MKSVNCLVCDEEIKPRDLRQRKYCSKLCYGTTIKGEINVSKRPEVREKISQSKLGEKNWMYGRFGLTNPNWKGGSSSINNLCRAMAEYRNWSLKVFARDDWGCMNCDRKRKKGDRVMIEAHHIERFSDLLRKYKIKTILDARECEGLWDIKNGITLCAECHIVANDYESYSLRSVYKPTERDPKTGKFIKSRLPEKINKLEVV